MGTEFFGVWFLACCLACSNAAEKPVSGRWLEARFSCVLARDTWAASGIRISASKNIESDNDDGTEIVHVDGFWADGHQNIECMESLSVSWRPALCLNRQTLSPPPDLSSSDIQKYRKMRYLLHARDFQQSLDRLWSQASTGTGAHAGVAPISEYRELSEPVGGQKDVQHGRLRGPLHGIRHR